MNASDRLIHPDPGRLGDVAGPGSNEHYRNLLELAPDAILIVDRRGVIKFANCQAVNWFGYPVEEMLGQSVEMLVPDAFRAIHQSLRESYQANPLPRPMGAGLDLHVRRKDGFELPVEISLSPLATEDGLLVTAIIRDVSDRREADRRIRELNARLEERTRELEAINRELEAFSYSVSHDLRAPLRGIDGFSQALLEDYGTRLDSTGQDYLRRIRAGTQRMGRLIDDLLHLSRIMRADMVMEQVDLTALAKVVAADLSAREPGRLVDFDIQPGLCGEADSHLIRVVLDNLFGNAWKFTGGRVPARIEFGVARRDDGHAFYVRDNGAGFDMSYVDKLFGAFQRLHAESEFQGTGIGLATVKRVIQRHGGRVWAEGAVDGGATFWFTLRPCGEPS